MMAFLSVFIGGGLGSSARYLLHQVFNSVGFYPYLIQNLLGAFLIGFVTYKGGLLSKEMSLLLVVGFLGGFTTFSSYIHFAATSSLVKGMIYIALHNILGFGFFILGRELSKFIFKLS